MRWRGILLLPIVILLAASVLTGCGSEPQPTDTPEPILPTPTPTQTATDTAVPADLPADTPADAPMVTLIPPQTPTDAPTSTATLVPPATPTDAPTATATLVPPATPTPTWTVMPGTTPQVPACRFEPEGGFAALWQNYKRQLGCPLYPTPKPIQDAEQRFDNGRMFWREDNRHIYVVYEKGSRAGTHEVFVDEWEEGDAEYSCAGTPPANRLQPKRGFGLVWCNLGGPAAAIGWALEEEAGFWAGKGDPLVQDFGLGVIFRDSAGTMSGMAYSFFGNTGTFVHVTY